MCVHVYTSHCALPYIVDVHVPSVHVCTCMYIYTHIYSINYRCTCTFSVVWATLSAASVANRFFQFMSEQYWLLCRTEYTVHVSTCTLILYMYVHVLVSTYYTCIHVCTCTCEYILYVYTCVYMYM